MDIEFHYYITYALAKRAGFDDEESYILAYSSQYVDDNSIKYKINEDKEDEYNNYISQTMNILKPKNKLMRIYPCFHFIPGEFACNLARRKDGKMHILNTTPDSDNANRLMDEALSTKNSYRIGIATHSFADTWAHQNFAGYFDYFNGLGGVLENLTPNVGHADAQHMPDIPGLVWKDERLITRNSMVNNKERFIEAAEKLFKKYKKHNDSSAQNNEIESEWLQLKDDLDKAIGREFVEKDKGRKSRMNRYNEIFGDFSDHDYDEDEWFENAVEVEVRGLPDKRDSEFLENLKLLPDKYYKKENFDKSHWFNFQEAVKEHQALAERMFDGIFNQMEIEER